MHRERVTGRRIMRKTRILLVGPFRPPIGGETVSTSKLLCSGYWAKAGAKISAINLYGRGRIKLPGERIFLRDIFRALRVFVSFIFRLPGKDMVLLWITRRPLCTLGLAIILVSSWAGKPVTVKVFGGHLVEVIRGYRPWYRRVILAVLRRAHRILPQTALVSRALVEQLGLPEGLVTTFPNFLLDGAFSEKRAAKEFGGRCVYMGQIKAEKGVFDIADALEGRGDLSCDFYGDFVERYRDDFLARTGKAGTLRYRGIVDPEDAIKTIGGYDSLLLPTRYIGEGLPAVILEAFAAGVPVISTEWMAIPEIIADGERGLLVQPGSPERIAAAIDRLAADRALYARIADNAFEYARKYSEKAIVDELLIGEILGLQG